jgi:hypothetical protein
MWLEERWKDGKAARRGWRKDGKMVRQLDVDGGKMVRQVHRDHECLPLI